MAKKKYYAVRKGLTPGIYFTWADCKAQVDGYSGAVYKSFETLEEAAAFAQVQTDTSKEESITSRTSEDLHPLDNSGFSGISSVSNHPAEHTAPNTDRSHAVAYVDGSYHAAKHTFSYGVVMFWNQEEYHMSRQVIDQNLVEMHNVAGEICGAKAAMEFALERSCTHLVIYHDYEGIAKWPLGLWKTNKEGTMAYKQYFDSIKDTLEVEFIKVRGHSNDKYNDLADQLAKAAIFD